LKFRADYEQALFSFYINSTTSMAGHKVESIDEGRELNLHIYVSDIHNTRADPVLVGFKGYTNERGDVSTMRSLVLEQKWVEPDPPWI
jgi:hypothetical protein